MGVSTASLAYKTSSDPRFIGSYFVEALETLSNCPKLVRTDHGIENCLVRELQRHLRRNHGDDLSGERSYLTGVSTANQHIESWCGIPRKEGMEYWIQLLGEIWKYGMKESLMEVYWTRPYFSCA